MLSFLEIATVATLEKILLNLSFVAQILSKFKFAKATKMKNEPIKIYVGRESVCAADDVKAHLYVSSDFDDFATNCRLTSGRAIWVGRSKTLVAAPTG